MEAVSELVTSMEDTEIAMKKTGTVLEWLSEPMPPSTKCAAFDMDDTLMIGSYPYPGAKETLKRLIGQGYAVVVFSNQRSTYNRPDKFVKNRVIETSRHMEVPIHFFCARGSEGDEYRKPGIGMLSLVPFSYGKVEFFVGDAAGRYGDFSDCDREFAKSAKIPFYTPEQYFNKYPIIACDATPSLFNFRTVHFLTMVILVGYPGSGKTTFCTKHLPQFARVSRDEEKSVDRCLKIADTFLKNNVSVVIDNLNAKKCDRKAFIDLAVKNRAGVFVVHLRVSMPASMKRNKQRDKSVPDVVFYIYRKNFELPEVNEGVDEVFSIVDF